MVGIAGHFEAQNEHCEQNGAEPDEHAVNRSARHPEPEVLARPTNWPAEQPAQRKDQCTDDSQAKDRPGPIARCNPLARCNPRGSDVRNERDGNAHR